MPLKHIVVAVDVTDASRHLLETAAHLARRAGARVTVLNAQRAALHAGAATVGGVHMADADGEDHGLTQLREWVADTLDVAGVPQVTLATTVGVAGVEVSHFAEEHGADLILVGRKPPGRPPPRLLGETVDSVARRSKVRCLFVHPGWTRFSPVLAALDGTERGLAVFRDACRLARNTGGEVRAVTVEPVWPGEPDALASQMPSGRTMRLLETIGRVVAQERGGCPGWPDGSTLDEYPFGVRRGDVVTALLEEVRATAAGVLAVGMRLHGQAGIVERDSITRFLIHEAPCAVLTVPL